MNRTLTVLKLVGIDIGLLTTIVILLTALAEAVARRYSFDTSPVGVIAILLALAVWRVTVHFISGGRTIKEYIAQQTGLEQESEINTVVKQYLIAEAVFVSMFFILVMFRSLIR